MMKTRWRTSETLKWSSRARKWNIRADHQLLLRSRLLLVNDLEGIADEIDSFEALGDAETGLQRVTRMLSQISAAVVNNRQARLFGMSRLVHY